MLAAFTDLRHAQQVKEFLSRKKALHPDYQPVKELDHMYFPVIKKIAVPQARVIDVKFPFPRKESSVTLPELLRKRLTSSELALLPHSQEAVGKILILEIPQRLQKKEKIIAQAYLQLHKNLETAVKKSRMHTGEYRLRKVAVLAGKKIKETVHRENGILLRLHLEKMYFSARLGSERLRIAQQVQPGEDVLVLFSGAGPYPLVIARNSEARHITAIELNHDAHQYAVENVQLNRLEQRITLLEGDARMVLGDLKKKYDRLVMPLPKTGELFLDLALRRIKKGGIVHYYAFVAEKDLLSETRRIRNLCKKYGHPVRMLRAVPCGQFAPGVFRVCFDMKVLG